MTTIKVTTNVAQVNARLAKRVDIAENDIYRLVIKATNLVEKTAKEGIHGPPKTGKLYKRGSSFRGNRPDHRASAAGEYPATDSGDLAKNIATRYSKSRLTGHVTSNMDYSYGLEFGHNGVAARPFLHPSLVKNKRKILSWFENAKLLRRLS